MVIWVVTAGKSTMTLVASEIVNVVVKPGISTAVTTPSIVMCVCSDGIITSVEPSPVKWKAVVLAENTSSRTVEGKVHVVKRLEVAVIVTPLTIGVN